MTYPSGFVFEHLSRLGKPRQRATYKKKKRYRRIGSTVNCFCEGEFQAAFWSRRSGL